MRLQPVSPVPGTFFGSTIALSQIVFMRVLQPLNEYRRAKVLRLLWRVHELEAEAVALGVAEVSSPAHHLAHVLLRL